MPTNVSLSSDHLAGEDDLEYEKLLLFEVLLVDGADDKLDVGEIDVDLRFPPVAFKGGVSVLLGTLIPRAEKTTSGHLRLYGDRYDMERRRPLSRELRLVSSDGCCKFLMCS